MTRLCKDCVFDNQNKLREVIKDVISCVNNEHTRLEQRLIAAEQSEQEVSEIIAELKAENKKLKNEYNENVTVNTQLQEWQDEDLRQIAELKAENKALYEEKNCLHLIIDRLLENSGYSKDIASAEDFEDVYEDMQIKRNELIELKQENKKLKEKLEKIKEYILHCYYDDTVKCNWSDNSVMPNCEYINECKYKPIDYLLHNIIEGAEDDRN